MIDDKVKTKSITDSTQYAEHMKKDGEFTLNDVLDIDTVRNILSKSKRKSDILINAKKRGLSEFQIGVLFGSWIIHEQKK